MTGPRVKWPDIGTGVPKCPKCGSFLEKCLVRHSHGRQCVYCRKCAYGPTEAVAPPVPDEAVALLVRIVRARTEAKSGEEREAILAAAGWLVRRRLLGFLPAGSLQFEYDLAAAVSAHEPPEPVSADPAAKKCEVCGSDTGWCCGPCHVGDPCDRHGRRGRAPPAAVDPPFCSCVGLMLFEGGLCVRCGGRRCPGPEKIAHKDGEPGWPRPLKMPTAAPPSAAPAPCRMTTTTDDEAMCFEHDRLARECADGKDARIAALAKELEEAKRRLQELVECGKEREQERDAARAEVERIQITHVELLAKMQKEVRRASELQGEVKMWKEQSDHAVKLGKEMERRAESAEKEKCDCTVELASVLDREKRLGDGRTLASQGRVSCAKHPFVFMVGWEKARAAQKKDGGD